MDIHINTVTQCAGQHHRIFALTVNGVARTLTVDREDIAAEWETPADIEEAVIDRIRSALKEAAATLALATWKSALEGKDFKI